MNKMNFAKSARLAGKALLVSRACAVLLLVFGVLTNARAIIEIEVTKGGFNAIPIAVVPFGWTGNGTLPQDVAEIISSDLARSGLMIPMARDELVSRPVSGDVPNYSQWRLAGVD